MEDIKIIHREETSEDWKVQEIAKNRAVCICRIQFKRCARKDCETCPLHERYEKVVSEMSEYDRYRLNSYVSREYARISLKPGRHLPHKKLVARTIWYAIVVTAALAFLVLTGGCDRYNVTGKPHDVKAYHVTQADFDDWVKLKRDIKNIISVAQFTYNTAWDIDRDGNVDCCDMTFLMYRVLKRNYNFYAVKMVWNKNPTTGMNHLFLEVWFSEQIYAEIETTNPVPDYNNILMRDIWGPKYDARYNTYDVWKWYKASNMEPELYK